MNFFYRAMRGATAFSAALLSACAGTTVVSASHDPLYRAEPHRSTITAVASNSRGLSMIRINVIVGEMTACRFFAPSLMPCRTGATAQTRTCILNNPRTGSCTFTHDLGDRRLVTYTAEAFGRGGSASQTTPVTYAAGASITEWRFGFFTIPWEVARPIWWHTGTPAPGRPAEHLDMGFFPDADMPDYRGFTDELDPILKDAHFNTATPSSRFYTLFRGSMFNLWAGPPGANAEGCSRSFTGPAQRVAGATDGETILHVSLFGDCASLSLGGSGTVNATEVDAGFVYTHESGHFILGLGDEYCCGGGYAFVSTPGNVFDSERACQSAAAAEGFATTLCVPIGTTGFWNVDDGAQTIMDDRDTNSEWRTMSGRAVGNRLRDCLNGNC